MKNKVEKNHEIKIHNRTLNMSTVAVQCEADQIYYFHMTGSDLDTHEIVRMDDQKGRATAQRFKAVGWFKDGELVTEEKPE